MGIRQVGRLLPNIVSSIVHTVLACKGTTEVSETRLSAFAVFPRQTAANPVAAGKSALLILMPGAYMKPADYTNLIARLQVRCRCL